MNLSFQKYHGNGNDFVMILDMEQKINLSVEQISQLCDRHFGIGADGLMLLRPSVDVDFEMLYFNSDGRPASMCGNGGRCIAALAFSSGIADKEMIFMASDGVHEAKIMEEIVPDTIFDVSLKMIDVEVVNQVKDGYSLNTGVSHFVKFVDSIEHIEVVKEGRKIRNSPEFSPDGINVNFVYHNPDRLFVRTYERGVEDETLSCGTGVTASAITAFLKTGAYALPIHTTGGDFRVDFEQKGSRFVNIRLRGPAVKVFDGEIDI